MSFKIQDLITRHEDGTMSGPMSPVEFAKIMCEEWEMSLTGLFRVYFDDNEINQWYESKKSGGFQSLTGLDTLVICDTTAMAMFIDTGTSGIPVAITFFDEDDVVMTPIYEKYHFEKKLSKDEISEIFNSIQQQHEQNNNGSDIQPEVENDGSENGG